MKRPQLRVGILGAGPISQAAHLEAVQKAGNCELHALCDRAPDLLETVGATWRPARTFGDLGAMLADPDVDAVIVAIADQFHVDAAMQARDAGKHVLVEKPMGVTVARAPTTGRWVPTGTSGAVRRRASPRRSSRGRRSRVRRPRTASPRCRSWRRSRPRSTPASASRSPRSRRAEDAPWTGASS